MKIKLLTILFVSLLAGPMGVNAALIGSYGTGSIGSVTGGTFTSDVVVSDRDHHLYYQGATTSPSNWVWKYGLASDATIDFTFSFDLTGYDLNTISLWGLWGVDNTGIVSLNGNLVSSLSTVTRLNFRTLTEYSTTQVGFFNQGVNNLVYSATNAGGPGAFRAAGELYAGLTSTIARAAAVPVSAPASLLLVVLGLAGFGARKRQKVQSDRLHISYASGAFLSPS
jgi:hypothetical protein